MTGTTTLRARAIERMFQMPVRAMDANLSGRKVLIVQPYYPVSGKGRQNTQDRFTEEAIAAGLQVEIHNGAPAVIVEL